MAQTGGRYFGFVNGGTIPAAQASQYLMSPIASHLENQGWDINSDGLAGAPALRVVLGEHAHSSVFKTLGRTGIEDLVDSLHQYAKHFAGELQK